MKKVLGVALIMLLYAGTSFGQGFGFGIKGGVNIANNDISGGGIALDTKSKVGFHAGAFATLMFSGNLGIQPEALFSSQGSKIDFSGVTGSFNLSYVNIPVLLRYNVNELISLQAGPQFGILLSAEQEFDGDTQDIKDDLKGSDVSLAFGVGLDLPMKLGFGARYVLGLSNISNDSSEDFKNGVIQLYVLFKLAGK